MSLADLESKTQDRQKLVTDHQNQLQIQGQSTADSSPTKIDDSDQDQKRGEPEYNHAKSYLFAAGCALTFGAGNYLLADVSAIHGIKAIYPQAIGCPIFWALFHIYALIRDGGCNKEKSSYYEKDSDGITKSSRSGISVPIQRCVIQGLIQVMLTVTFSFASKSGVNSGIIATIFSTCVPFTSILFYCRYAQVLTKRDWVGCFLIIVCVVLIGFGGSMADDGSSPDPASQDPQRNLILAVACAVATGAVFSMNTLNVNFVIQDLGFPADQMNYDGNMLFGALVLPFYILDFSEFSAEDVLKSNASLLLVTIAINCFSFAIQCGKGANVQAIENMKTVVQTVIAAVVAQSVPGYLEIIGLLVGLGGVFLIILQKRN